MTDFEYSAFLSYRNGKKDTDDLLNSFIKQFYDALQSELKTQTDGLDLFLDIYQLEGGTILNAKIGNGICKSVCYIPVFTRNYLSTKKMYCAAELMGILEMEEKRIKLLGWENEERSFIFPVILRNREKVPDILGENRISYDFCDFTLSVEELKKNGVHVNKFKELANSIADLYELMENESEEILKECETFKIRDINNKDHKAEIQAFIKQHSKRVNSILKLS